MSIGITIMGLLVGFLVGLTGVGGVSLFTPSLNLKFSKSFLATIAAFPVSRPSLTIGILKSAENLRRHIWTKPPKWIITHISEVIWNTWIPVFFHPIFRM